MPTDPATTSQVQAYRFVLRRMESALIRRDAVMLHEPQRHHLRAMAVGVVLAVLGLVAVMIFGGFGPASNLSAATGVAAIPPLPTWENLIKPET
jgi:Type VII secretion system ESX-1, transport TM domain B